MTSIRPIQRLLIANRGEIAARIARTAREMGIETVAVFSDADADGVHVSACDLAVRIGPAEAAASYLNVERVLEAARRTGADAIHPGYGFLSENAAFARACEDAGITFVGPGADAIDVMGSKQRAKEIAIDAGVPTVPGYDGAEPTVERFGAEAQRVGYPVLLKASAGGGGKGMQIVRAPSELADALASAQRVAKAAFGDDTMLLEKYVERPRHVEIQILADAHGNVVHLFERECSIQRRHQKIIEESPSPAVDPALRARMGEAAASLARAIGYRNAGTVEFLLGPDGSFYFLEVNTRLQVEHPVTEMVTGVDIVREQLRIAEGYALRPQEHYGQFAHAVEARLYAEDVAAGFLPSTGTVLSWRVPEGVRVDAGVETGSAVSVHYDPMLAKIIALGTDRIEATRRLASALEGLVCAGVVTNRAFLVDVLRHPAYLAGDIDTHFIDQHWPDGWAPKADAASARLVDAAVLATRHAEGAGAPRPLRSLRPGWRLGTLPDPSTTFGDGEDARTVRWRAIDVDAIDVIHAGNGDDAEPIVTQVRGIRLDGDVLRATFDGVVRELSVVRDGHRWWVAGRGVDAVVREQPRFAEPGAAAVEGGCVAPMPGAIVEVRVSVGDRVEAGAVIAILEAMKMEHRVTAPEAGEVTQVLVAAGDQVEAGAVIAVVAGE